jgi:ribosome biogenesis protein MAK21
MKWLQEVRRAGTTADKVAAMTLLLQESALANLRSLDDMLRWASKRSGARAVAGQACTHSFAARALLEVRVLAHCACRQALTPLSPLRCRPLTRSGRSSLQPCCLTGS